MLHWKQIALCLAIFALFFFLVWLLDRFMPTTADYEDLHNAKKFANDQKKIGHVIDARYSEEVVDPYLRIKSLEHEIHGLLVQVDTLHEIIYSLRQNPSAKPKKGVSGLGGVDTQGQGHSSLVTKSDETVAGFDDATDCA